MQKNQSNVFVSEDSKQTLAHSFDTAAGIARFAKKEDLYYKSLLQFIESYHNLPDVTNEADAKFRFHTIKGTAGNLGINTLYEAAKALEMEPFNQTNRANYLELFDDTAKLIRKHVQIIDTPAVSTINDTHEALQQELKHLENALKSYDIDICEQILKKIHNVNWAVSPKIDFAPLTSAIESYDYSSATEILLQLQSNL